MTSCRKILDFILFHWANNESSTVQHQLRRITLSSLIAIGGLGILGSLHLHMHEKNQAVMHAVFALVILSINIGIRFRLGYRLSLFLLTTLYFLFCVAIACFHTQEYVSLLWMLLLPMLAISALGKQLGMLYSVIGGFFLTYIIFDHQLLAITSKEYEISFGIHFLLAYIMISLFSHCSEALRLSLEANLLAKNRHLESLARTDSLTGLPNRRGILEKIQYEAIRCQRTKRSLGIVLGDIDSFKSINDQYGHSVGDSVLKTVAVTLQETIRAQDSIAYWPADPALIYGYSSRYGGEEFLILLPETNLIGAKKAAQKLRQKILNLKINDPRVVDPLTITMSFGVSLCHGPDEIDSAIEEADTMLYRAKQRGRNQVQSAKI